MRTDNRAGRALAELFVNLVTNGALGRIDERSKRARELYQWGLHPHHAELGSPLAADNEAFEEAYPLVLAGDAAVTQESLFPMMNASENLNAAGILAQERTANGSVHASSILQLCRSATETSARTIWLLSDSDREVRRDRCMSIEMEQLEQQSRFLKIDAENENGPNPRPAHIVAMNASHRQKHAELIATNGTQSCS